MAIKTTRWSPDTCSCVLEYEWDDSLSPASRVHTLARVVSRCTNHQDLNDVTIYTAVQDESGRKNYTLAEALTRLSAELSAIDPDTGGIILKSGITFNWSWTGIDDARVLNISFIGITLSTSKKNILRSFLDSRFGSGKVVVL